MARRILLFHLLLTTFIVLGCLTSTTEMFEQRLVSPDQPGIVAGSGALTVPVDLRENTTWEEHHEDIDRVERIGFEAVAYSNNGAAAVFNIGFRTDPAAEFVRILSDLTLAPETTSAHPWELKFGDSEAQLVNRARFAAALRDGRFELRIAPSAASFDLTIQRLDLIVVLSASI